MVISILSRVSPYIYIIITFFGFFFHISSVFFLSVGVEILLLFCAKQTKFCIQFCEQIQILIQQSIIDRLDTNIIA